MPTADWYPTYWTKPLSEDFTTDGEKVINISQTLWRLPEKHDEILVLTDWQKWLIRHVLERYPDDYYDPSKAGRLRYKQVVISMPRKNGKSLLGALFALYGMLLHEPAPEVISVATLAPITLYIPVPSLVHNPLCHLVVQLVQTDLPLV